jgi:hypothetical protein
MTAMVQCISTLLPRNIIYDGFIAYSRSREKKGATAFTVTPWFFWWAMKDSSLQPPDEEIPRKTIKTNDFSNFNG